MLETEASARGAQRDGARRSAGRRLRVRSRRACSRSATTATASRARSARRSTTRSSRPADVGMIVAHGNGTRQSDASEAAAIRRVFGAADAAGHGVQVGVRPPDRRRRHHRTVLALAALARGVVPGIATLARLDPACAGLPVSAAPQAPRSKVALILCRGFARHQRRAGRPRRLAAAPPPMADAACAGRPLRHRHGRDRAHRTPARRNAGRRTRASSFRRRNSPTAATAPAAPRASPRASPRRRPASSCSRARRRWAQIEPADFSVARDDYGAPQIVCRPRAQALLDRHRIASIALSLTHDRTQRVGGRAGRAGAASTCRSRAGSCTASCRCAAR